MKANHAIIYSGQTIPQIHPDEYPGNGEDGMLQPIKVNMRSRHDRIDPMSRINFKSMTTIQHNWKVYDVGEVDAGSMALLRSQWRKVWRYLSDENDDNQIRGGKERMEAFSRPDGLNAVPEAEEQAYEEVSNARTYPSTAIIAYAMATHDYSEYSEDQLRFMKGDYIHVTAVLDENWGQGWCARTGEYGLYPRSFVQHIS